LPSDSNFSNRYTCDQDCGLDGDGYGDDGSYCGDGIIDPYPALNPEECDSGLVNYDITFVFDTSGSLDTEAGAFCSWIDSLVTNIANTAWVGDVIYRVQGIHNTFHYTDLFGCVGLPGAYGGASYDTFPRITNPERNVLHNRFNDYCRTPGYTLEVASYQDGPWFQPMEDWGPAIADVSYCEDWEANYGRYVVVFSDESADDGGGWSTADGAALDIAVNAARANNVTAFVMGTQGWYGNTGLDEGQTDVIVNQPIQTTGGRFSYVESPEELFCAVWDIFGVIACGTNCRLAAVTPCAGACDLDDDDYFGSDCSGPDCVDIVEECPGWPVTSCNPASINPGATEDCDDGIDNNCVNGIDCADLDCATDPACYSCTDSDGRDYTTPGTVSYLSAGDSYSNDDSCSGNTLTEWYCLGVTPTSESHDCTDEGPGWTCPALAGACIPPGDSCADDDGGPNDYRNQGTVIEVSGGATTPHPDSCTGVGQELIEWGCSGTSAISIPYNCAIEGPGWTCSAGACIPPPDSCTDSDLGATDYTTQGTVIEVSGGTTNPYTDSCSGDTLTEWGCSGDSAISSPYDCINEGAGWTCSGGECIPPGDSCTDTDGLDYTNQGTVSGIDGGAPFTWTDSCPDGSSLREYWCDASNDWRFTENTCDNLLITTGATCSGGICIPPVSGSYYCNDDGDGGYSDTSSGTCSPFPGCIPAGCQEAAGNDCNDSNPLIYSGNSNSYCNCEGTYPEGAANEIECTDNFDNDCDGDIDCQETLDCPAGAICTGDCEIASCNSTTHAWDCLEDTSVDCGECGDCQSVGGHYNCQPDSAFCSNNYECGVCQGSGINPVEYDCAPDHDLCTTRCTECGASLDCVGTPSQQDCNGDNQCCDPTDCGGDNCMCDDGTPPECIICEDPDGDGLCSDLGNNVDPCPYDPDNDFDSDNICAVGCDSGSDCYNDGGGCKLNGWVCSSGSAVSRDTCQKSTPGPCDATNSCLVVFGGRDYFNIYIHNPSLAQPRLLTGNLYLPKYGDQEDYNLPEGQVIDDVYFNVSDYFASGQNVISFEGYDQDGAVTAHELRGAFANVTDDGLCSALTGYNRTMSYAEASPPIFPTRCYTARQPYSLTNSPAINWRETGFDDSAWPWENSQRGSGNSPNIVNRIYFSPYYNSPGGFWGGGGDNTQIFCREQFSY
jgi:hypothetical protein